MGKRHLFIMIVFKHFLQKKITKMKRYRNLALVNFLQYGKMKKLFALTKSNQRFFHRINFCQFWGLERSEFWFLNCGREGMTRNVSHFKVDGKMIFRCQGRPLYHWNCTTKAPETLYSIKKCHSNRKTGCCSYLATS